MRPLPRSRARRSPSPAAPAARRGWLYTVAVWIACARAWLLGWFPEQQAEQPVLELPAYLASVHLTLPWWVRARCWLGWSEQGWAARLQQAGIEGLDIVAGASRGYRPATAANTRIVGHIDRVIIIDRLDVNDKALIDHYHGDAVEVAAQAAGVVPTEIARGNLPSSPHKLIAASESVVIVAAEGCRGRCVVVFVSTLLTPTDVAAERALSWGRLQDHGLKLSPGNNDR